MESWDGFKVLIGKTVKSISVNGSKDALAFETDEGWLVFEADGDCCSRSWFEHISNVSDVIGKKITGLDEISTSEVIGTRQECDRIYGFKFTLEDDAYARFAIEMRNSSNGYYGGSVCWVENGSQDGMKPLTEDF